MLDILLAEDSSVDEVRGGLSARLEQLRALPSTKADSLVDAAETQVRANAAAAFLFNAEGLATLRVGESKYTAGHFDTPSIGTLHELARKQIDAGKGTLRLFVLTGASPFTDIGTLQATAGSDSLFQVASQFNCLEAPNAHIVPVREYFGDPTQGPRASISAFPATLLRHYAAPDGEGTRFVQVTDGQQIDLLAKACGRRVCRNGYFTGEGLNAAAILEALTNNFDEIEVGLHQTAEVVLGHNWTGSVPTPHPHIAQVFTSTAAGGAYGAQHHLGAHFDAITTQLLRAAYTGTLLAAASIGARRAVLTLIGGGVFANPVPNIWRAILEAVDAVAPVIHADLDIVLNGYNLGSMIDIDAQVRPEVRSRNGAVIAFDRSGVTAIDR